MKKIINNNRSELNLVNKSFSLEDAPHWVKFAAVRDDERLCQAFMSYVADSDTDEETVTNILRAFLHMDYDYAMRDDIEQFCGDYENAENTTVQVVMNADGITTEIVVSINGAEGVNINLYPFSQLAEFAA